MLLRLVLHQPQVILSLGLQKKLFLGNLDAERDWGHARDYVDGMWRILQHSEPDDFVLATETKHSVRDFVELAFNHIGIKIAWSGDGVDEIGRDEATGRELVFVDPKYFRPSEVDLLIGDSTKAKNKLGWIPEISLEQLVEDMMRSDKPYLLEVCVEKENNVFPMIPSGASVSDIRLE